jgi:hypothetical protein
VWGLTKLFSSRVPVALAVLMCALTVAVPQVGADGCGNGLSPDQRAVGNAGEWAVEIEAVRTCRGGVKASVQASQEVPGEIRTGASIGHPLRANGVLVVPIYCRRDDYLFLPPTSLGGLPCVGVPATDHFDPLPLALRMEAELPPPYLHIGMNPGRGMVAVPTWFWVEGYDGGMLSQSETVLEAREECHFVAVRDDRGSPVLDVDRRPKVRRSCTVETTTFVVDVRLWPTRFAWDFGDGHGREIVCPDQGECADALGQPYVDSTHPSPVQHPYRWSSLGVNGAQDAYTINLGITFGAQYRVSVNGWGDGWRGLSERPLTWSASHQVQEAQAVLTRP